MSIIETNFGHKLDPKRIALGSASTVSKKGAFYVFSIRVDSDDIREYSFSNHKRAVTMRKVLSEHLENRIRQQHRKTA